LSKYYDVPKLLTKSKKNNIDNPNQSNNNPNPSSPTDSTSINSINNSNVNVDEEENTIDSDLVDSNLNDDQQNLIKSKVLEFECININTLATRTNWCKKQNFSGGNLDSCKNNFCDFCCNHNSTMKGECKNDCEANTVTELMSEDIINKCSTSNYNPNPDLNYQSCKICCENNKNPYISENGLKECFNTCNKI